ncbi:MAG: hypothetical protein Q4E39_03770 [bacterium]|nr:hypothetical protein [bacterium]
MEDKNMGILNKNAQRQQVVFLFGATITVILVVVVLLNFLKPKEVEKLNVSKLVENAETKIIFVENSDKTKCKKCSDIKKYLDDEQINYVTYDVSLYTKKEYNDMLKTIEINPDDFGYPAVIYIRDGKLYSNVINLSDTKPVKEFIKTYELKKVK